jgi:hypothetical protein
MTETTLSPESVTETLTGERTREKKIRAYSMLKELLDLEKPIISSKMVDFLEQDGTIRHIIVH